MSRKTEMEKEIKLLRETLDKTRYELHRVNYELIEVRGSYVRFLRKVKRAMGLKNWPKFRGNFLDGVSRLVCRRLKVK